MVEDEAVRRIVATLNQTQTATILALGDGPGLLGCSEPFAKRLAKETTRRPALVIVEKLGSIPWPYFRLNDEGQAVKAHLLSTKDQGNADPA